MIESSPSAGHQPAMVRPALHFTAQEGWINDPVGLTYHHGMYHQFFQYVPSQTVWSPECRWGHAVSEDLLTWTERDVVLAPGDGDGGCWSGSLVVNGDGATIFYTSVQLDDVNIGRIRTAHPEDDTWNRWRKGPMLDGVVPTPDIAVFRDPQVTRYADGWRMLVGAGRNDETATAMAYTSSDLKTWTSDGEFASRSSAERDPIWTGLVWECPQLISLGDKHALLFSVWEPRIPYYEAYAIGQLISGDFVVERWGRLSYGDAYYAGSTFADADGRAGLIYWLRGIGDSQDRWAGAHSLPHLLRLDIDGVLIAEPHPNIAKRRHRKVRVDPDLNHTGLPPVADLEWSIGSSKQASLTVLSADGEVLARMYSDDFLLQVTVGEKSWQMPSTEQVRLIIDGPILELFSDSGVMAVALPIAGALAISISDSACSIYEL